MIEKLIAYVLRIGVFVSAGIIALGLVLTWVKPAAMVTFKTGTLPLVLSGKTSTTLAAPVSLGEFSQKLSSLDPTTVMDLGLILLILLPIIRVALTVVVFLVERDYIYLGITSFVFAVLLFGIFFGKGL